MAELQDVAEDLLSYATYLVKRLVRAHSLEWDHAGEEDAAQTLFLAGWQVWRNERNIALAKNRMKSRRANLLRDFFNQRKRQLPEPSRLIVLHISLSFASVWSSCDSDSYWILFLQEP